MATPIDFGRWALFKATIEACLREGYAPPNMGGVGKGSSVAEAERRLRGSSHIGKSSVLPQWLIKQRARTARGLTTYEPDWKLFAHASASTPASPRASIARRWLLTAAQNDAELHRPFWNNWQALARFYGAQILVGKFTYQLAFVDNPERAREEHADKKRRREYKWAPELEPYLVADPVSCGAIEFRAEMNTLPTAVRPLQGLLSYGQGKTVIFPHAKVALETVPTMPGMVPPIVTTTGCCTVDTYTDTKAGHKAQFHHIIGGVIVEEDSAGRMFLRHIIAMKDGTFQDKDVQVRDGKVTTGHRAEAVVCGDTQLPYLDPLKALATWGFDIVNWSTTDHPSLIDALRPRFQFLHDLIDFKPISHHDKDRAGERFDTFVKGDHLVEKHIGLGARFLRQTQRDYCRTVVIGSNHDRWLERWLDREDHRKDRDNALAFLRLSLARHEAIARDEPDFDIFRHALRSADDRHLEGIEFSGHGQSFRICEEHGGIECGNHGDMGPNGARGTPTGLTRVATRMNVGDKHAPGIWDGLYVAGISCLERLRFNRGGPSSWRHADIITYPTAKRTLIFPVDGKNWA